MEARITLVEFWSVLCRESPPLWPDVSVDARVFVQQRGIVGKVTLDMLVQSVTSMLYLSPANWTLRITTHCAPAQVSGMDKYHSLDMISKSAPLLVGIL